MSFTSRPTTSYSLKYTSLQKGKKVLNPSPSKTSFSSKNKQAAKNRTPVSCRNVKRTKEISMMILIKEKIDKIMLLSNKVMKNNETEAPQIKALLQPSLTLIKKSFPNFYRAGTQYFVNMETLIDSASTNQILSSASAKISREIFGKNWEEFCQTIDSLTHTKPPPHTKEIISKFQSISSSMEYIKTSNENRKYPTSGLTKYINNVQSLCDDVCNNVIELFSQPSFPFFEIDLMSSIISNVRSFLSVINRSFGNQFLQSGVVVYDLNRIKSNIFADCNEVIVCIKSAFAFPLDMNEIWKMVTDVNALLEKIMKILSIPFASIKNLKEQDIDYATISETNEEINNISNKSQTSQTTNVETIDSHAELIKSNQSNNEFDLSLDFNLLQNADSFDAINESQTTLNKVQSMIQNALKIIDPQLKMSNHENLIEDANQLLDQVKTMRDNYDKQAEEIKNLKMHIHDLSESLEDKNIIMSSRNEIYDHQIEEHNQQFNKLKQEKNSLLEKYNKIVIYSEDKDREISQLKSQGDANLFKTCLITLGNNFISKLNGSNNINLISHKSDDQLINMIQELQNAFFNQKCQKCEEYEKIQNESIKKINEVIYYESNGSTQDFYHAVSNLVDSYKQIREDNHVFLDFISKFKNSFVKSIYLIKETNIDENLDLPLNKMLSLLENEIIQLHEQRNNLEKLIKSNEEHSHKNLQKISHQLDELFVPFYEESPDEKEHQILSEEKSRHSHSTASSIMKTMKNLKKNILERLNERSNSLNTISMLLNQRKDVITKICSILYIDYKGNNDEFLNQVLHSLEVSYSNSVNDVNSLKSEIKAIYDNLQNITKILMGVLDNPLEEIEMETDPHYSQKIFSLIYKIIDHIKDQKEDLKSHHRYLKDTSKYQECLISVLAILDPCYKEEEFDKSGDKLIERVLDFLHEEQKFKENNILTVSEIDSIFKPCIINENSQEHPKSYLKKICKVYLSNEKSLLSLKPLQNELLRIFDSIDSIFNIFNMDISKLHTLQKNIHDLNTILKNLTPQIENPNLLSILSLTLKYMISSIDFIESLAYFKSNSE